MSIKLIIFDLDGVLIESKDIHYRALNLALAEYDDKYVISYEDHINRFDGKPTSVKLNMLLEERGLPASVHDSINKSKQEHTYRLLSEEITENHRIVLLFWFLKKRGYFVAVASNSIRKTTEKILSLLGVRQYCDFVVGNDDVLRSKPNPEMYYRCMIHCGVSVCETMIVEDSYVGRIAAHSSGANVYGVNSPNDVSMRAIFHAMCIIDNGKNINMKWKSDKLNVLIPMAGAGSRFEKAGYTFPKPLIDVAGRPMVQVVVDSLMIDAHYIFIVQKAHMDKYNMRCMLNMMVNNPDIVVIDGMTEGAACTVLKAKEYINNDNQLVISNSDQFIEWDSSAFMYSMQSPGVDGGILTFENTHPQWSYVKVDENGWVTEVAEKKPISNQATVGVYMWKKGSDFVKYAEQMIEKNVRVNGEFYVCPVHNEAIADGKKFKVWPVDKMMGLGTPELLDIYLRSNVNEVSK